MSKLFSLLLFIFLFTSLTSQGIPENWMNLDIKDGYYGVSTQKTYDQLLKNRIPRTVVVAVIDSGVDIEHEDLYQSIWLNEDEIPGNGIDDDKNGYIDDVHGWNFIGGPDGKNVHYETLEVTRLYASMREKYEDVNPLDLSDKEKKQYAYFLSYKKEVDKQREKYGKELEKIEPIANTIIEALEAIDEKLKENIVTEDILNNLEADSRMILIGKSILSQVMNDMRIDSLDKREVIPAIKDQFKTEREAYYSKYEFQYNPDYDSRKEIVKDNYSNSKEKFYGNNDVTGPDAMHGTHVAGIIAAGRNNLVGMDGVASDVKIMSIRVVPDGDERDKDVANAIRYAVDNGAQVINMSFGKGHSWDKDVVDDAVKYADKKDVLIVHASGNDGLNIDKEGNFPNKFYHKTGFFLWPKKEAKNWIEVSAISYENNENLAANFSNYGKQSVDLFAPGMAIYSTVPGDGYQYLQGTSMASPVVAGVAAVLRSYFPALKANQVKKIIMETTVSIDREVIIPGGETKTKFSELSNSGGIINLYNAVKLAITTKGKKKIKPFPISKKPGA